MTRFKFLPVLLVLAACGAGAARPTPVQPEQLVGAYRLIEINDAALPFRVQDPDYPCEQAEVVAATISFDGTGDYDFAWTVRARDVCEGTATGWETATDSEAGYWTTAAGTLLLEPNFEDTFFVGRVEGSRIWLAVHETGPDEELAPIRTLLLERI